MFFYRCFGFSFKTVLKTGHRRACTGKVRGGGGREGARCGGTGGEEGARGKGARGGGEWGGWLCP